MWKIILLGFLGCGLLVRPATAYEEDRRVGDECESHDDCDDVDNAICSFDVCECAEHFLPAPDNKTCLPFAAKLGDPCRISAQCSRIPQAQCVANACTQPQAVLQVTVQPVANDNCTENSQCPFMKVCRNGTCELPLPTLTPATLGLDKFAIGLPCSNDTDCPVEGARCLDKVCRCWEDFVVSQNLKSCLPKAKSLGDSCNETVQCSSLNGSICEKEKCVDKVQQVVKDITDKIPLLVGSTCQTDKECSHLSNALCLENVCQCRDGFVTSITSSSCLAKAKKEGDPCQVYKQCEDVKGSTCVNSKCVRPAIAGFPTKVGAKQGSGGSRTTLSGLLSAILLLKMILV